MLLFAARRPDGPSWSPYLAVGLFLLVTTFVGIMYGRKRR